MFKVKTLNNISKTGLDLFPHDEYIVAGESQDPDVILLRSYKMHDVPISDNLIAVGRAGAGVNNIPVAKLTALGIPVFNTPGANANAVKELVIAGMFLACRNLCQAWDYTQKLNAADDELNKLVEEGKKQFAGFELPGRTLGVIGLGAIGVEVANAALALGMNVVGFDPSISVQRAWQLSSHVEQASSLDDLLSRADFTSVHVPLLEQTRDLIDATHLAKMKRDAVLLNFSRGPIVDNQAVADALEQKKLQKYVCDFPSNDLKGHPAVIALPHLGASTKEAEENCARMVVRQVREFLEFGNIHNSVNFPEMAIARNDAVQRITISNANVPNMVGQISTHLAEANINIIDLLNRSRGEIAYTIIDINERVSAELATKIAAIHGVLKLRLLG